MRRLFISDLHLSPARPELTRLACDFLDAQLGQVDEIYILGDIFNTWLGDDLVPAEFRPFVSTLQNVSASGINLFLMVGNRDFMLGHDFASEVGATLLKDNHRINYGNHPALLIHGDTLCLDDISYQRYRKVVRNRLLQWCFLRLPARFRQNISDRIIAKSKQKKQHKTAMIMDVNQAEVRSVIESNQIEILVHGHTHRPAIHQLQTENGHQTYRVVLGDWDNNISYLLADDQQLTLHDHRLDSGSQTLRLT
ncbi:UDP-2,3-diacylglucosamine diphosphatase [Methylophaga sp.]|uniref:UDP-2,3-diacylglucosamine diphosphatase n=1 Tax=Methylophaga sp. TaxID=2024840 RepID=UPI0013FF94E9|nr:UDP-2,3-diacylglucosamine diphosphatase [Methylophaga sp.]MTI64667.1 UDP-2,3-diacylglucosamine diphosphatase [Methylophaga sp.]